MEVSLEPDRTRKRHLRNIVLATLVVAALTFTALGQTSGNKHENQQGSPLASSASSSSEGGQNSTPQTEEKPGYLPLGADPENRLFKPFFKHMVGDQERFWTSPKEFRRPSTFKTFGPFLGFTGLLIASDSWLSKQVPNSPSQLKRSKDISDYAVFSLIGAGAGSWVLGHMAHNDHLSETGLLAGEAAINSTIAAYVFKEISQRQRPYLGNGHGDFFVGGTSFPSEHAAAAWSIASVIAHEYPSRLTQIAAYGLASAVTLTRVTGRQHFPADAFVGSVLGWYLGRQVYRAHHNTDLGGSDWGDLLGDNPEGNRNPSSMASPYVPLDSWVYPALTRLAALGYIQSAHLGMRPWTRLECARLLSEASDQLADEGGVAGEEQNVVAALNTEFSEETARLNGAENLGVSLDSVYSRVTGISSTPLRDGYHLGETIINDFGRPYGKGFNSVDGFISHAEVGPLAFFVRGEYQHAPAMPSDSANVLQAISSTDDVPPVPNGNIGVNRFDVLEWTVAFNVNNAQFSFGKQSLWLGPTESGSFLMSDNAEPIMMARVDSVSPYRFPLISKLLGPMRTEFFIGQLAGHHWELCVVPGCQQFSPAFPNVVGPDISPQPFIHGGKISVKPTENLELGAGYTAMFGGPGLPVTWHDFLRTFYAHSSTPATNPGKRTTSANFSYRVPGLRNWLTIYADSLAVDEVSPVGSSRASVNPGVYMPQIPGVPKLEIRAEGLHESLTNEFSPGFVYSDSRRYHNGYTNDGILMGNWIGRAGRGGQGWMTYSWSPKNRLQVGYRLQEVSHAFLEGGRLADYSARADVAVSSQLSLSGMLQYEQWRFPLLSATRQSDTTASVQMTFYPHLRAWRK